MKGLFCEPALPELEQRWQQIRIFESKHKKKQIRISSTRLEQAKTKTKKTKTEKSKKSKSKSMSVSESNMSAVALAAAAAALGVAALAFLQARSSVGVRAVATDKAPAAVGPYVQATKDGKGTIYVSGQVGFVPGTKKLDGEDAASQARRALSNVKAILEAAGSSMDRVLKTTVLLVDIADYAAMNEVYAEAFGDHKPARAAFAVKTLPVGARVEIEAIALEN
ncbi:2-iminobutanoate/2-iminopropanoate deaminase [Hondaea fermentalgiana]|uniref:2-iminobutanoate/2-iminopropanoate deaminase n=1 Tax=Hondaea fermentalgiana TaxID=2315210 RepID=A0A2R5GEV7_9STRA|nr:2-iminobutanoate/2-iminopropanoate deaminase [Hondaea fermentalgiana]|eukprot:GBG26364.1 2-iminobutanoate/2-iminopropanoate deaminase [Hondaea fermentalgiana]